ncbi:MULTISPECIES: hypothetical protein [unclassified Pseudoxanthomonas]|uniref:hypothetical protein n=1 Tax=unclassified Pseudoxanthomonas TaxID=2645906 RepID=UPI0030787B4D
MGVPMDTWFDALVAEHPDAEKYRPNMDRIIEMYWEETNDRASWEEKAKKLKLILDDVLDGDKRLIARRQREKEANAAHYEKASGYANLIVSAGYAALIVAWSTTFRDIDKSYAMIVGALALTSLLLFIGWEILKMIASALEISRRATILAKADSELLDALEADLDRNSPLNSIIERGWIWQLFLALPTGLASGVILIVQVFKTYAGL